MEILALFGWWVAPAIVTLAAVLILIFWKGFLSDSGSDIGAKAVSGLLDVLVIGVLVIVCLIAWLIWALLH